METNTTPQIQVLNVVKKFVDLTRANSNDEYILSVIDKIENFDNFINILLNKRVIKDEDIELFYKVLVKHIELVSYINTNAENIENYDNAIHSAFKFIEQFLNKSESENLKNLSEFSTYEGFDNYFKTLLNSLNIDYEEYEKLRQERIDSITSQQQRISREVFALMEFLSTLKDKNKKYLKTIYATFLKQVPNNLVKLNKIQNLASSILVGYINKYGENDEFKNIYKYIQEETKLPEDIIKQGNYFRKNFRSPIESLEELAKGINEYEIENSHE